jgi:hypothetical protein
MLCIIMLTAQRYFCTNRQIFELAEQYRALVFLDESHATGFFGKTGRYDDVELESDYLKLVVINFT